MRARSDAELMSTNAAWLGRVPKNWRYKRLKYVVVVEDRRIDGAAAEQPYVGLEHIESWSGRLSVPEDSTSAGIVNVYKSGDVLLGKLRPYLAKVHLADRDGVCTTEAIVLSCLPDILSGFLFYSLANAQAIENINSSTYGAKMPRANWEFIGEQIQPIPCHDEQRDIVTFLNRATARIDALVVKNRLLLELLEERRLAVITNAVTKGLDPNVRMKDSNIDWLGQIPRHWQVKSLRRIAKRIDVGIAEAATHAYADAGVPIIRTTNVRADRIDTDDIRFIDEEFAKKNSSKFLHAGDLLTVRTGVPGTTAVVPDKLDCSQCFTMLMWPAPGSADTELGVLMEPEVSHGKAEVYTRVQA